MILHYNRRGRPISLEQWARELEANRRVAWDDLGKLGVVSTVYLGLDHSFGGGPPLIFETMVFGGPMDEFMDRYSTEEQALGGHRFVVQALLYYRPEKRRALIHNGRKPRQ